MVMIVMRDVGRLEDLDSSFVGGCQHRRNDRAREYAQEIFRQQIVGQLVLISGSAMRGEIEDTVER